jgi:hypothetical protein
METALRVGGFKEATYHRATLELKAGLAQTELTQADQEQEVREPATSSCIVPQCLYLNWAPVRLNRN